MNGKPDRAHRERAGDGAAERDMSDEALKAAAENVEAEAAGAGAAADTGGPEADLPAALAAEKARADENWDRYLRAAAEAENVRKRAERDVENVRRFAIERFATELLAVKDSLELGLAAGEEATNVESLLEGMRTTLRQLAGVLERFGVAEVNPEGEPFDPGLHEAMTTQPTTEVEPNTVLIVYQKGYTLNGRLLRPARVVVAASPPPPA